MKRSMAASAAIGVLIVALIFAGPHPAFCQNAEAWPERVLITNDNGIDDIKIIELAKAFSEIAVTYVVAPDSDKSGSSHNLGALKTGSIKVERVHIADDIEAYAVDGYPADCVALALAGIMKDDPPDLVVSGINGGPNLGSDWLGSGTIGAARMASFAGLPAIAVSGLNTGIQGSLEAATKWIVSFSQSPVVRNLQPPAYLTVSIPRIPANEIKGVRLAERSGLQEVPVLQKVDDGNENDVYETWQVTGMRKLSDQADADRDIPLYESGYIVIVPMRASEVDYPALDLLRQRRDDIPDWPK